MAVIIDGFKIGDFMQVPTSGIEWTAGEIYVFGSDGRLTRCGTDDRDASMIVREIAAWQPADAYGVARCLGMKDGLVGFEVLGCFKRTITVEPCDGMVLGSEN